VSRIWLAAVATVVVLALFGLSAYSYRAGKAAVQQEWDKEKAAIAQAHLEEMQRARQREAELQAAIDKQTEGYKRDLENITADYQRIVVWLRDRPAARAGAGGVQSFLQGTLPTQPAPEKHSTSASGSTTK